MIFILPLLFTICIQAINACPTRLAWDKTWNQETITYWIDPGILAIEPKVADDIKAIEPLTKPVEFTRVEERSGSDIKIEIDNDINTLGKSRASSKFIQEENGSITVLPYFESVRCMVNMDRINNYPDDKYNQRSNMLRNAVRHEVLHGLNLYHMRSHGKHVPLMVSTGGGSDKIYWTYDDRKAIREIYADKKPVKVLTYSNGDVGKTMMYVGKKTFQVYVSKQEIPVKFLPKGKYKKVIIE